MNYFCRPAVEQAEASYIPATFSKTYAPHGPVTLNDGAILDNSGVDLVDLDGETLAIHPESVGWSFLSKNELPFFRQMRRLPFEALAQQWPSGATPAQQFVTHLFRRGLITINGLEAVDSTMFRDSPNYNEGQLVELLLTERCNLACGYCLAGANKSMPVMDEEIGRKSVDLAFASDSDPLAFEFAGGEPFLQFDLMKKLVRQIQTHPASQGRAVFLSVQTNATVLNDERALWLRDNDIRVGISLDGKPQAQNRSRPQVNGGESYPALIQGIELLKRHQISFGALVVLNRSNIDSVEDLVEFLLEHRIFGVRLNPVVYLGTARQNWDQVGVTQEEIIGYFKEFVEVVSSRGLVLLEDNLRSMIDFLTSKQRRTRCMRSHCGAGDTFQSVAANGDIYPGGRATQSPGLKMGSIFDSGLVHLAAAAENNPIIGQIRSRRPHTLDECGVCHYRQLCQAGCSAQAYELYGTVRHRTPECSFYMEMYPYLMRRLSFDQQAFAAFEKSNYLGHQGSRFASDLAAPV